MSEQIPVNPSPEGLAAAVRSASDKASDKPSGRGLPPVHLWHPPFSGDMDMRIARDGTWFHEGSPINRPQLVQLFSSILRREGDAYFLVTPVEKVGITVEDAPFVAIDFAAEGEGEAQVLTFETHVGDVTTAGPDCPIRIEQDATTKEPSPYVMVRAGLEARIDRKSFYRLIELGRDHIIDGVSWFGLWSGGQFFPVIQSEDLA